MITNGSQMRRSAQNWGREEALRIISGLVYGYNDNAPVQIQKELYDGWQLKQTGAGRVLHKDLLEQEQKSIQKQRKLEKDYNDAIMRRDMGHQILLDIQKQQAWDEQRQIQERLDNMEDDNHDLHNRVKSLTHEQDRRDDVIENLMRQVQDSRRRWEREKIRSAEELRKSRELNAQINKTTKNSHRSQLIGYLRELLKIDFGAAMTGYFR